MIFDINVMKRIFVMELCRLSKKDFFAISLVVFFPRPLIVGCRYISKNLAKKNYLSFSCNSTRQKKDPFHLIHTTYAREDFLVFSRDETKEGSAVHPSVPLSVRPLVMFSLSGLLGLLAWIF